MVLSQARYGHSAPGKPNFAALYLPRKCVFLINAWDSLAIRKSRGHLEYNTLSEKVVFFFINAICS
jgi:hypothetical protein